MKKWICLLIVLLAGRGLVEGLDLSMSVKAGLCYPFYSGQDYRDFLQANNDSFVAEEGYPVDWGGFWSGKHLGSSVGLSLAIGLSDSFVLQPEIYLARYGAIYGFDDPINYGEVRYVDRLRCIEATLLGAVRFGRGIRRAYVFVGPGLAVRWGEVGLKVFQEGYLIAKGTYLDTQFAQQFFVAVGGAGITFYLRNGLLLSLEGRCSVGLTSAMDESTTGLDEWRANGVQLILGIGRVLGGIGARSNVR